MVLQSISWSPFVLRDGRIYDVGSVRVLDGCAFDYLPDVFRVCEVEISRRHSENGWQEFQVLLYPSAVERFKFEEDETRMCRQIIDWTRGWVWTYLNEHKAPIALSRCDKPIVIEWR